MRRWLAIWAAILSLSAGGCQVTQRLMGGPPPDIQRAAEKLKTGRTSEAFADIEAAIQRAPSDARVYLAAAEVCLQNDRPDRAVTYVDRGLQATRGADVRLHAALHSAKGIALQAMGDLKGALMAHQAAMRLMPEEPTYMNNVAYTMAELDESDASLAEAEQLASDAIDRAVAGGATTEALGVFLDTLGWVQFRRGDLRRAVASLTRAADMVPDQPEVQYHVALAYLALGRREDAIVALERAVKLKPRFPEAARRLQELRQLPEAVIAPRDAASDNQRPRR